MRLGKTRESLEEEIKALLDALIASERSDSITDIIDRLNRLHGISKNRLYSTTNNLNEVSKLELPELALFGIEIVFNLTGIKDTFTKEWFTERELKEFARFQQINLDEIDEYTFPKTFTNVTELGNGYYNLTITKQELSKLRKYGKLNYNEKVQRGSRKVEKYGGVYYEPITDKRKIAQIKAANLKGEMFPSVIALNAVQMSAVDGLEIDFDSKTNKLTINEGTVLDIVDGMHRVLGTYAAWLENPDLEGSYIVLLSNKSDEEVKQHQVDIDKSTKLLAGRIKELSSKSIMSEVIERLKATTELKGKITSGTDTVRGLRRGELFPYAILLNVLEKNFKISNRLEAIKLAKQIEDYNVYLFGYFGECEKNEYKMLFDPYTYEGHLVLMKKMIEQDISFEKLNEIINIEDFAPEGEYVNKIRKDNNKGTNKEREAIKKYFTELVN